MIYSETMQSPIGLLEIRATAKGISYVEFCDTETVEEGQSNALTARCKKQLQEYFSSKRSSFDLPLDPEGTAFQKSVWHCLGKIPFGESVSYRDIADCIANPKAVRAVGAANGRNPISIIVPCHRVIGSNQSLTGYAGGLERKAWLLKHEGIHFKEDASDDRQADLFEK